MDPDLDCCDVCGGSHETQFCPELELVELATSTITLSKARLTLPQCFEAFDKADGTVGVFAKVHIPAKSKFGPFEASRITHEFYAENSFLLKIFSKDGTAISLDTTDENECNWMCLVQTASTVKRQNTMAIQIGTEIYYITTKNITTGQEIMVWYAPHYAKKMGKSMQPDVCTKVMLGMNLPAENETVVTEVYEELELAENTDSEQSQVTVQTPDQSVTENCVCKETKDSKNLSDAVAVSSQSGSSTKAEVKYHCHICSVDFNSRFLLDQHMYMHDTGKGVDKETTQLLSASLQQAMGTMPKSLRIVHPADEKGPFKCNRCDQIFEDSQSLAVHIKCEHLVILTKRRGKEGGPHKQLNKDALTRMVGKPLTAKNCRKVLDVAEQRGGDTEENQKDEDSSGLDNHRAPKSKGQGDLSEDADINQLLKNAVNGEADDHTSGQQPGDARGADVPENGPVTTCVEYMDHVKIVPRGQGTVGQERPEDVSAETVTTNLMCSENILSEKSLSDHICMQNRVTTVSVHKKDLSNGNDSSLKEAVDIDTVDEALKQSQKILDKKMSEAHEAMKRLKLSSLKSATLVGCSNDSVAEETSEASFDQDKPTSDISRTQPTEENPFTEKDAETEHSVQVNETQGDGESEVTPIEEMSEESVQKCAGEKFDLSVPKGGDWKVALKQADADSSVTEKDKQTSDVKRKRGRPRKSLFPVQKLNLTTEDLTIEDERKRTDVESTQETTDPEDTSLNSSPIKSIERKKRIAGRPRRYLDNEEEASVPSREPVSPATSPVAAEKKRGRPRKCVSTVEEQENSYNDESQDDDIISLSSRKSDKVVSPVVGKRKQGRPRKHVPADEGNENFDHVESQSGDIISISSRKSEKITFSCVASPVVEEKKQGRPRKYEQSEDQKENSDDDEPQGDDIIAISSRKSDKTNSAASPVAGKRKRGRPRKYVSAEERENSGSDENQDNEVIVLSSRKSDKIAFSFATSPTKILNSPTPIRPKRERRSTFSKSEWVIPKFCHVKIEKLDFNEINEISGNKEDQKNNKSVIKQPKTASEKKSAVETEVIEDSGEEQGADEGSDEEEKSEEPKGRSRKRKFKGDSYEQDGDWKPPQSVLTSSSPVKRGRGRPVNNFQVPIAGQRKRKMGKSQKKTSVLKETEENYDTFVDDDNRLTYRCKECAKQFYQLKYVNRHMAAHRGTFTCDFCKKSFARKETLLKHICALKEEGETLAKSDHMCKNCGKMFKSEAYLEKHMEVHTTSYGCDVCGQCFSTEDLRDTHECKGHPPEEETSSEKNFSCDFCGHSFSKQSYLYRHMAAHTGEFTCDKCSRWFSRKESLLEHMRRCNPEGVVTEEGRYPCEFCAKVFSRRTTLENHMHIHRENYKCTDCKKSFTSVTRLETHKCVPVVEKDGMFVCEVCEKRFTKQYYLQRHMAIHSNGFYCNFCNNRYARKDELMKHVVVCASNIKIRNEGSVNCHVCGETFSTPEDFSHHVKSHTHPYKCNDCGRMFMRKINMQGHKCNPMSDAPTECHICKKQFRSEKYLKRHHQIHEEAQYQCEVCQKKFHRVDYLNNHTCRKPDGTLIRKKNLVRKKHKYNPPEESTFMCHICGKSYLTASNLKKHMFTHGEKEVECPVCGKRFHHQTGMNEHLKGVHTNSHDFQCKECGRHYKSRHSLIMHVKHFHGPTVTVHECPTCGRQFRQKANLKKHRLMHSDKKTYLCNHCQQTFKYPEQLRRHTLEHLHGQRYSCDHCDRKFVMLHELKKHVKVFHQGLVYRCEVCGIECRHHHTMKRHLKRRHPEVDASSHYVNCLMRKSENLVEVHPRTAQENNPEMYSVPVAKPAEPQSIVLAEPDVADMGEQATQTFIIQKEGNDTEQQTVVIDIQTNGQFDSEAVVSQQVAEALQSLHESVGIEGLDSETTISIGDISQLVPGQPIPVSLTGPGNAETQGFILVPTVVEEHDQTQTVQEITLK